MSEWVFPVLGVAMVFLVKVPLLTLVSRTVLSVLPVRGDGIGTHASAFRYLLVIGPTLVPVVWLVSASIHQSEADAPLVACVIDHLGGELCLDVLLFALALTGIIVSSAVRRAWCERERGSGRNSASAVAQGRRVRRICKDNARLAAFSSKVVVVDGGIAPACTRGLLWPHVELSVSLVSRLTDDELSAVLLHEVEHALCRDPARFFLAHVALSINPLGRLLAPELARHHFAREVLCDRRAVQAGADPLVLANCILSVAAPAAPARSVAALGGHGMDGVRLRVQLLLGYVDEAPSACRPQPRIGLASVLLVGLAIGPHVFGTGPLDVLHHGIERAALLAGLG